LKATDTGILGPAEFHQAVIDWNDEMVSHQRFDIKNGYSREYWEHHKLYLSDLPRFTWLRRLYRIEPLQYENFLKDFEINIPRGYQSVPKDDYMNG
jgi:hypothetical protein